MDVRRVHAADVTASAKAASLDEAARSPKVGTTFETPAA
jgi:hypothetical protein